MERPCFYYMKPYPENYEAMTVEVVVYETSEFLWEYDDFSWEQEDKDEEYSEGDFRKFCRQYQPTIPKTPIENMNLQSIVDLLPEGVSLSDVKIRLGSSYSEAGASPNDCCFVTFYYNKYLPADPEGYKRAKAEYDKEYSIFESKLKEYEALEVQKEIDKLEKQLKCLKNE